MFLENYQLCLTGFETKLTQIDEENQVNEFSWHTAIDSGKGFEENKVYNSEYKNNSNLNSTLASDSVVSNDFCSLTNGHDYKTSFSDMWSSMTSLIKNVVDSFSQNDEPISCKY